MTQCTEMTASRANVYAPQMPRKQEAETDRIEGDISLDVDCAGAGVTITESVWAIDAADDDGSLTLGTAFISGLVVFQPFSGGTAGKSYLVENTVTMSDGLVLVYPYQVVIAETVKIQFGG